MSKKIVLAMMGVMVLTLLGCASNDNSADSELTLSNNVIVSSNNEIHVTGTAKFTESENIYVDFASIVEDIYVKEGDVINIGDKIITFSDADYEYELNDLQVQLQDLERDIQRYDVNLNSHDIEKETLVKNIALRKSYKDNDTIPGISSKKEMINIKTTELEVLKQDYETAKEAVEAGIGTVKEVENLEQQIAIKEAEIKTVQEEINEMRESNNLEINKLEQELKRLENTIEIENEDREYNKNKCIAQKQQIDDKIEQLNNKRQSPNIIGNDIIATKNDCFVDKVNCTIGTRIPDTGALIITVKNMNSLEVQLSVDLEDINKVKVGQKVELIRSSKDTIEATVSSISDTSKDGEVKVNVTIASTEYKILDNEEINAIIYCD